MSQINKAKRMEGIELLRMLSMLMVVLLHYLDKGGLLGNLRGPMTITGYVAWILETFAIVAVNVYMLISGFFLVESGFKSRRLITLLCQVLFYSLLVPLVLILLGVLPVEDITIYNLLHYVLPAQMEHYWFVTAYVTMYLLTPVLCMGVKHMSKKQLKYTILLLLLFFSLNKSVIPMHLEMDKQGYDSIWFVCVFLGAAYMRLYGIPFFDKGRKGVYCYLLGCMGILGITLLIRAVYLSSGKLEYVVNSAYHYNHILNLFAAVSLFYAFYYCKIGVAWLKQFILRVAPYTFGVYLLHEHITLRYLWPRIFGANSREGLPMIFLRLIGAVLTVFCVGILVDMIRSRLFGLAGALLKKSKVNQMLDRLDAALNPKPTEGGYQVE